MHVDGSSNPLGAGAGVVLEGPDNVLIEQFLCFTFKTSNNQAEYEAIIAGLNLARDVGVRKLLCKKDSKLTVGHLNGEYQIKDPTLAQYYHMVMSLTEHFDTFQIQHVPRSDNTRADILSKLASTKKKGRYKSLLQHTLATPSIEQQNQCLNITTTGTWMEPFIKYLEEGVTPANEEKGWIRKAARYTLIGGKLFRRGFSKPLLKYITREKADYVIQEIHQGICDYHSRPKTMAARILRAGYYWPTMEKDCTTYVKKCVQCQKHEPITHMHQEELHHVSSPWPFSKWGMDIIGPFAPGKGQVKFLLVAVDYFSKWIEAEPLAIITASQVHRFIWKNIICRYGIPHTIITDNGRQFIDKGLADFYHNLKITHITSSVEHPQTNGQAEAANKIILGQLKKRLDGAKGK